MTIMPPVPVQSFIAENIARVVAESLGSKLDDARVRVHRVEVWETDTCGAIYYR